MYEPFEDQHKIFTNVVTKKPMEVIIQTTDHKITGNVHIRPDHRLTDEINTDEPFLAVTEAKIYSASGEVIFNTQFLAVGRSQIIWIIPKQEMPAVESDK